MADRDSQICFRVTFQEREELRRVAEKNKLTVGQLARSTVLDWLSDRRQKVYRGELE